MHNLKPHVDTAWEKQRGRKGNEMKVTVEKVVDTEDRQFEDAPIRFYSFNHASIWYLFSNMQSYVRN